MNWFDGLVSFVANAGDKTRNYFNNNWNAGIEPIANAKPAAPISRIIRVEDTTPKAKERNNLTTYASTDLINKVVASAKKQGVDPYAALAETWKENVFGNADTAAAFNSGWINPMQYNALDLAPVIQPGDKRNLRKLSREVFDDKIRTAILSDSKYRNAVNDYNKIYDNGDYAGLDDIRKAKSNVSNTRKDVEQNVYIDSGVGYLKKMLAKNPNLTKSFAAYRGTGQAAAYHGRHTKELYDVLKNNPEINKLVAGAR